MIIMSLKDRGNQYFQQAQYQQAIQCYQKYLEQDSSPDRKAAYANISFCYFKLQQYTEAIQAADSSIEEDQTYAKAYYRKMQAFRQLGNNDYEVFVNAVLVLRHSPDISQKAKIDTLDIIHQHKAKWLSKLDTQEMQIHKSIDLLDPTTDVLPKEQPVKKQITAQEWLQRWQNAQLTTQLQWEQIEDIIVKQQQYGFNLAFLFLNQLQPSQYELVFRKIKDTQNTLPTKMDIDDVQGEDITLSETKEESEGESMSQSSSDPNLLYEK